MSLVLSFSTRGIADTRGGVTHAGAERGLSLGSPDVEDATCHGHLPASRAPLARRCCEGASLHAIAQRAEGPCPPGGHRPGIGDAATAAGGSERSGSHAAGAWHVPGPAPPHRSGRPVGVVAFPSRLPLVPSVPHGRR